MKTTALFLCAVIAHSATHAQIFKCPDASGRLALQQAPCEGGTKLTVRPASGQAPGAAPQSADGAKAPAIPSSPTATKPTLEDERLARERWVKLNDARLAASRGQAACQRQQERIGAQKSASRNNLAGATRDVSISNEMQAAAAICQTQAQSADRYIDQLKAECDRLGCTAPSGL